MTVNGLNAYTVSSSVWQVGVAYAVGVGLDKRTSTRISHSSTGDSFTGPRVKIVVFEMFRRITGGQLASSPRHTFPTPRLLQSVLTPVNGLNMPQSSSNAFQELKGAIRDILGNEWTSSLGEVQKNSCLAAQTTRTLLSSNDGHQMATKLDTITTSSKHSIKLIGPWESSRRAISPLGLIKKYIQKHWTCNHASWKAGA